MTSYPTPLPLFDTLDNLQEQNCHITNLLFAKEDFELARSFLLQFDGSLDTFNSYRREIERLIQWAWFIHNKAILKLDREDIEVYLKFCQKPPKRWIGLQSEKRFTEKNGIRIPNPRWRPFVKRIPKSDFKYGQLPEKTNYQLSQKAFREIFSILNSFYNYLLMNGLIYL